MLFRSLSINEWRQFERVQIDFHDHLTILTGANGSGKTTILNLLASHYNWQSQLVSNPKRDKRTGAIRFLTGKYTRRQKHPHGFTDSIEEYDPPQSVSQVEIGTLAYSNDVISPLAVPTQVGTFYNVNPVQRQAVQGLHIPSHRPVYFYQGVSTIPTQAITRNQLYQEYFTSTYTRYLGGNSAKSPIYVLKEALIALAVFGVGNVYVTPDETSLAILEGFQDVLRQVLPPKIGFKNLSIQIPDVLLETKSGTFPIDAVSGGVASIIDMAWRIYMFLPQGEVKEFVCTIDEPENHLHPELQQSLLPNLMTTFPHVQFIVATHNPFMITAAYDSKVYVFDYNTENRVEANILDTIDKAGTANEILRDVLGIPFTMPLWAEKKLESILQKYADQGVDDATAARLEAELSQAGLQALVPEPISLQDSEPGR